MHMLQSQSVRPWERSVKNFKIRYMPATLMVILSVVAAQAGQVTVGFTFTPDQVSMQTVQGMQKLHLADGVLPADPAGTPWLPARYVNVLIPSGAKVLSVTARARESILQQGISVYPAQPAAPPSRPRPAFVPPQVAAYALKTRIPTAFAEGTGAHTMRGFDYVSVRLNPLRYTPAFKQLFLAHAIEVTVTYAEAPAPRAMAARNSTEFAGLVDSLVVNPGAARTAGFAPRLVPARQATLGAADYVIITRASLTNAFKTLAAHRASRFTTSILTVESITNAYSGADAQARIRSCISNQVASYGTLYVVLGGDDTIVPVRDCYANADGEIENGMPTDLYYSGLNGNWNADGDAIYGETSDNVDMAWDVIVGRIPVRTTAHATNYIGKLIAYENTRPANLQNKMLLGGMVAWDTYTGTARPSDDVATYDSHLGFRDATHTTVSDSEMWDRRLYRDGIRPYWTPTTLKVFCDTLTSWDTSAGGDYAQTATNVKNKFNLGWTHMFFSGHGSPDGWGLESGSFSTTEAAAMTNLMLVVYTDACLTGYFDHDSWSYDGSAYTTEPCLGEALLRNARGGALIHLGCSRFGWGEPDATPASNTSDGGPSTQYGYLFYKRLYQSNDVTVGKAFAMHKADKASSCTTYNTDRWIQFGLNLLGDPAFIPGATVAAATAPTVSISPAGATKSVTISNALTFVVTAAEPDSDTISLRATNVPSGAVFSPNPKTGSSPVTNTFSWTPTATGTYTVAFLAGDKDGTNRTSVTITVSAMSGSLALNSYQVKQYNSAYSYTIPAGVSVDGAGYVVIARNASKSAFESYWGVVLDAGVAFINSSNKMPQINGAEQYELLDNTGVLIDGLTPAAVNPLNQSVRRVQAGNDATLAGSWTTGATTTATPGSGATGNGSAGLVINEYADAGNYNLEFMELYYDAGSGGGAVPAPAVAITNPATASLAVDNATATYTLAGTCNASTVGLLAWTNSLTGAKGTVAAGVAWSISGVALNVGTNAITVRGTNTAGVAASAGVSIARAAGVPASASVTVTNPPTAFLAVDNTVSNYTLAGTCNTNAIGHLAWTNTLTKLGGRVAAATAWTLPIARLDVGDNAITLSVSNSVGAVASASVTIARAEAGPVGGGTETFANYSGTSSYADGTFTGQDGSTWTYARCRGDMQINGSAPTLGKDLTPMAYVRSGVIGGGCGALSFKYRRSFTSSITCDVYVANTLVTTLTGGDGTTQTYNNAAVNIAGDFVIVFTNRAKGGQVTIDDVTWTSYGASVPGAPAVTITNPALASIAVDNATATYTLAGTCNSNTVGLLAWTNSLTGAKGTLAAGLTWSLGGLALNVGTNVVTVRGTNTAGAADTASVTIVRAAASGGGGGGGTETFANYPETSTTYNNNTFLGQDGSTWAYVQCSGDQPINGRSAKLGKDRTPQAYVRSGAITGGCGSLSFKYRKPNVTTLNCDVYVNNTLVTTITGGDGTTQTYQNAAVSVSGDFALVFSNKSGGGQIVIDDITWTGYSGGSRGPLGGGLAAELFFSEYIEGTSDNKYLEIYNGTGAEVDLANYTILTFVNGSPTMTYSRALSGTLADHTAYVIENSLEALGVAADLSTTAKIMTFNGNDAIVLSNMSTHAYCDIIGRIGEDPGAGGWTADAMATVNQTLVRDALVAGGITANPAGGFPSLATEWEAYPSNTISYLGSHTFSGGSSSALAITDPSAALLTVENERTVYTLVGTCDSNVVGELVWTNTLTHAAGTCLAAAPWSVGAIGLEVGPNIIIVRGTNAAGAAYSAAVTITRQASGVAVGIIQYQGFEGAAADTWGYGCAAGSGNITATQERAMSDQASIQITGSNSNNADPCITFDNVSLAGWCDVRLSVAFSAAGPDTDDDLYLDVSYDNGASWTSVVKLVDGFGNANVAFGGTSLQRPATVSENPWTLLIPAGISQVAARLRLDENAAGDNTTDSYYIDDVKLAGARDSDDDGMPDTWEADTGLDPDSNLGVDGTSGDHDGDGVDNHAEYVAGTQPTNPDSLFCVDALVTPDSAANNITINAVGGRVYTLLYTTNLFAPDWTVLRCVTNATDGVLILDGDPDLGPGVYYRVKVSLEP